MLSKPELAIIAIVIMAFVKIVDRTEKTTNKKTDKKSTNDEE